MLIKLKDNNTDGEIIENKKFSDFQMSERNHLQEVIAKNPEVLGEDLLIISKEFSNWENTSERLDLLALDKNQNLVVIENKLDDSGKDVTWQILKYASYVSTLTKDDIVDIYKKYLDDDEKAEKELLDFFEIEALDELDLENEKGTQRLLMVANNFRSEIISATMWMIDNGIQVKCVEVKPYEVGQEKVLNFEQIIPVKDMEEYLVKVALKTKTNAITKQKNKIMIYPIEHHLDGKSEQVKKWYKEIKNYIFNKNENFEEVPRQQYISYELYGKQFFRLYLRKSGFVEISGDISYDIIDRVEKINKEFSIQDKENKIFDTYGGDSIKNKMNGYGRPSFKIETEKDLEIAKKFIKYVYEKNN